MNQKFRLTIVIDEDRNRYNIYTYNKDGKLKEIKNIKNENESYIKYHYNEHGNKVKEEYPFGYCKRLSYDIVYTDRIIKEVQPNGQTKVYTYENKKDGKLLEEISYHENTPNKKYSYKYFYNDNDKLIREEDDYGYKELYFYDERGLLSKKEIYANKEDKNPQICYYFYNEKNLLSKEAWNDGSTIEYSYDKNNNLILSFSRMKLDNSFLISYESISYTKNGDIKRKETYDQVTNEKEVTTYTYDKYRNLIEKEEVEEIASCKISHEYYLYEIVQ